MGWSLPPGNAKPVRFVVDALPGTEAPRARTIKRHASRFGVERGRLQDETADGADDVDATQLEQSDVARANRRKRTSRKNPR